MDKETISNRILDSNFGLVDDLEHSDEENEIEVKQTPSEENEEIKMEVDTEENPPSDEGGELSHYGVLGMKWGVRKDKYARVKNRDRKYEGESDQDYQRRMERESQERKAKIESKAREKQQKREIKDRAAYQKRMLKSQEKQQKMQIKAQEKQREEQRKFQEAQAKAQREQFRNEKKKSKTKSIVGDSTKTMTDQELNDAINRLRREQEYKNLIKKPDSFGKKTVKAAAAIGGGIMVAVGKQVITKQLSKYANAKIDDFAKKKGFYVPDDQKQQQKQDSQKKNKPNKENAIDVDFTVVDETVKKYLGR